MSQDNTTSYDGAEFVLVIREDPEKQTIEVAGFSKPEIKPGEGIIHPSHFVGAYIASHFDEILRKVEEWVFARPQDADGDSTVPTEGVEVPMIEAKAALLDSIERGEA